MEPNGAEPRQSPGLDSTTYHRIFETRMCPHLMNIPQHPSRRSQAFTLVEMILVVALAALIIAIAVPGFTGVVGSMEINTAVDQITGELRKARQMAMTQNRAVEVRFYQFTDDMMMDGEPSIRMYQSWRQEDDGILRPMANLQRLPKAIVISPDTTLTRLGTPITLSAADRELAPSLPSDGTYLPVRFQPDGSTTFTRGELWHLTIKEAARSENPPTNFATFVIEPLTGAVKLYRPGT